MSDGLPGVKIVTDEEILSQKDAVMLCMPTKAGPASVPADTASCNTCGQDVWISSKTSRPLVERGLKLMCMECLLKEIAEEHLDPSDVLPPRVTRETLIEAVEAISKEVTEGGRNS